jgi:hypothetical protein
MGFASYMTKSVLRKEIRVNTKKHVNFMIGKLTLPLFGMDSPGFSQPILQVISHCHLGKVVWDIQNRSDEETQKAHMLLAISVVSSALLFGDCSLLIMAEAQQRSG